MSSFTNFAKFLSENTRVTQSLVSGGFGDAMMSSEKLWNEQG